MYAIDWALSSYEYPTSVVVIIWANNQIPVMSPPRANLQSWQIIAFKMIHMTRPVQAKRLGKCSFTARTLNVLIPTNAIKASSIAVITLKGFHMPHHADKARSHYFGPCQHNVHRSLP